MRIAWNAAEARRSAAKAHRSASESLKPAAADPPAQSRIQQLEYRLAENMRGRLSERRERFGNAVTHLEAVSP
jgi:exonuclease VII large subunit